MSNLIGAMYPIAQEFRTYVLVTCWDCVYNRVRT